MSDKKNTRIELVLTHITSEQGRKTYYDDTGYKPKLNSVMLKACSNVDAGCQNTEVRAQGGIPFDLVSEEIKGEFSEAIPEFFASEVEAISPQDDMPTTLEMLEEILSAEQARNKKLERKIKKLERDAKPAKKKAAKKNK